VKRHQALTPPDSTSSEMCRRLENMGYTSDRCASDMRRYSLSRPLSSTNSVFADMRVVGCVSSAEQDALKDGPLKFP
jgi:hypothetical protein